MGKQSRLEKEAISKRHELELKKDYQRDVNEYSANHPDAKSDGDRRGKGVGSSSTPYLLPNENESKTSYKSTIITDKGGDAFDIEQRRKMQVINIYGEDNQYGPNSVDSEENIKDGQYFVTIK